MGALGARRGGWDRGRNREGESGWVIGESWAEITPACKEPLLQRGRNRAGLSQTGELWLIRAAGWV